MHDFLSTQATFRRNRQAAGRISDEMLWIPLLCGRGRSFAEGFAEQTGMLPAAFPPIMLQIPLLCSQGRSFAEGFTAE